MLTTKLRKRPRRRKPGEKLPPATATEARRILAAPPEVWRVYRLIVTARMDNGRGPRAGEVWGAYYHGNPRKLPRARHYVDRKHNGRMVRRAEPADPRFLLDDLRGWGVRYDLDLDGSVHLISPVYDVLRPIVEAERSAGRGIATARPWPPRRRYRGPKRNFR